MTMSTTCVGVNKGHFTSNIACEFICKLNAGSRSKAMGQMLMPNVGGGPF